MRIAVDAMGGDHAPDEIVRGALLYRDRGGSAEVALVGRASALRPLVGTPRHIADEMIRMHAAGFAGTTVSFVNFKNELPYFIDRVLPLLRDAGLRER